MWNNKMDDLDADEEWSDDDYGRSKNYAEKDHSDAAQYRSIASKHPPETQPPESDPISLILNKIDAELAFMKDRDVKISASQNPLGARYQDHSLWPNSTPHQMSSGHQQRDQAAKNRSETDNRSSNTTFDNVADEKQQQTVVQRREDPIEAAPSDDERDRKSNSGTPRDLDPLSAQEIDRKFKEIMLKKKGKTPSPLSTRISSWNINRPSTTMLSAGYGTDSESVRTEDFEAKFMGMMVQPSESDGRLAKSANTKPAADSFEGLTTDMVPTNQGIELKPKSIITTRPRSLSPRRTSFGSQSKPENLHQTGDESAQQLHRRNNHLFSWDDVFWKDLPKKGPQSITSTTSTFEEVESLCLSKRSSYSMGSSQGQWNRVNAKEKAGFSRSGVSPSRRTTSRQSSVTSSSTSRSSAQGYNAPTANISASRGQTTAESLLESFEFINSHGDLDLAEKILLENLLQRVLDNDGQSSMPPATTSLPLLNDFFRTHAQPYPSPNARTSTNNQHYLQSGNSNTRENGTNVSNSTQKINVHASTPQRSVTSESKRRRDLILPDDDNTNRESKKQGKQGNERQHVSNTSSDGSASSRIISTDSQSKTSVSSSGMDSVFLKEAMQVNNVSQPNYQPNLATFLPPNSFVQRGSFERTATPPDPYVINQPYTTSHAERVLMGLGFSSTEGFLPERFLRDWYDKISKAQIAAVAEMKERESFDSLPEHFSRAVSRKPSLMNTSVDFGSGQFSQVNFCQSSESPVREEQATVMLPSSIEGSKLERLNEYIASFHKSSSPGEDITDRRTTQFASSRQNSLPLFLETFSKIGNGGKSRAPRVDSQDNEARLEMFLAELLARKNKHSQKALRQINASDSGSDSLSSFSENQTNSNYEYYTPYSSRNKKRNTEQRKTTQSQESSRHTRDQSNGKYGGCIDNSTESKEHTPVKNANNSHDSLLAYSTNQKVSPIRQSAIDIHASHEDIANPSSINEEHKVLDTKTNRKRGGYNQRKHIEGTFQKKPEKTEFVQSTDSMEVADFMRNETYEGHKNKEDEERSQVSTRNPALKNVEPAMVSIVLEDVDQDQTESSFDLHSGSFERSLLGIPSSRRSSVSLSPIPQSPVTVIEVSLDNQLDSLDTEGTGSSKDTDEDSNCVNSAATPGDDSNAQASGFSRRRSWSPKAERLKRARSSSACATVGKTIMVKDSSTDSADRRTQRRLSLEVPLVPELRQALEKQKIRKLHNLNKSSDGQIKVETDPQVGTDENRSELAMVDSAKPEEDHTVAHKPNSKRNEIAENDTITLSKDSLELPVFSENGGNQVNSLTKPTSGYEQQYLQKIRTDDANSTPENTPRSQKLQNPVFEFKISSPGSNGSSPESFKSAFRDARRRPIKYIPETSAGCSPGSDAEEIVQNGDVPKRQLMANSVISENGIPSNFVNSDCISYSSPSSDHYPALSISHPGHMKARSGQMFAESNDSLPLWQTADQHNYPSGFDTSQYYYACDRESQCDMPDGIAETKHKNHLNHYDKFTQTGIPKFEISCQTSEAFVNINGAQEHLSPTQDHSRTKAVNTILCLIGKEHDNDTDFVNYQEDVISEIMFSDFSIVDETLQLIDAELLNIRKKEFERQHYLPNLNSENQIFLGENPPSIRRQDWHTDETQDAYLIKRNSRRQKANVVNERPMRIYAPLSWEDATRGVSKSWLMPSLNVENNKRLGLHRNDQELNTTQGYAPQAEYTLTDDAKDFSVNVSASISFCPFKECTEDGVHLRSLNSADLDGEQIIMNTACSSSRHPQKHGRQTRKGGNVKSQRRHMHKIPMVSSENTFAKARFHDDAFSDNSNCDSLRNMQQNLVTSLNIRHPKHTSGLVTDEINLETENFLRRDHSDISRSCVNAGRHPDVQQMPHNAVDKNQRGKNHARLSRLRYQSSHRTSSSSFEIESDFMAAGQYGIIAPGDLQSQHENKTDITCAGYCGDLQKQQLLCLETAEDTSHIDANTVRSPTFSSDHEKSDSHYEHMAEELFPREHHLTDVNHGKESTLKEFTTPNLKDETVPLLNGITVNTHPTSLDNPQSCTQTHPFMGLPSVDIPEIIITRADSSDSLHLPQSPIHLFQKASLPSSSSSSSSAVSGPVHPDINSQPHNDTTEAKAMDGLCIGDSVANTLTEAIDANRHTRMIKAKDLAVAEGRRTVLANSDTYDSAFKTFTESDLFTDIHHTRVEFNDANFQSKYLAGPALDFDARNSIHGCELSNALCLDNVKSPPFDAFETHPAFSDLGILNLGHKFKSNGSTDRSGHQSMDVSSNKSIAGSDYSQYLDDMDVLIEEARHMRNGSSSSYSEPVLDLSDSDASFTSIGSRNINSDNTKDRILEMNDHLNGDSDSEKLSVHPRKSTSESSEVFQASGFPVAPDKTTAGKYPTPNDFRGRLDETPIDKEDSKNELDEAVKRGMSHTLTDFPMAHPKEDARGTKNNFELVLSVLHWQNDNPDCTSHETEACSPVLHWQNDNPDCTSHDTEACSPVLHWQNDNPDCTSHETEACSPVLHWQNDNPDCTPHDTEACSPVLHWQNDNPDCTPHESEAFSQEFHCSDENIDEQNQDTKYILEGVKNKEIDMCKENCHENCPAENANNKCINEVVGSKEIDTHKHHCQGNCPEMSLNKNNITASDFYNECGDDADTDMHCVPTLLVREAGENQDQKDPPLADSPSTASTSTDCITDSMDNDNIGTHNINVTRDAFHSELKTISKTTGVMEKELKLCINNGGNANPDVQPETNMLENSTRENSQNDRISRLENLTRQNPCIAPEQQTGLNEKEFKPCIETAVNTNLDIQPDTNMSEGSTCEDSHKNRISRLEYLTRHYPSIAPEQPSLTPVLGNMAESDKPQYQYWQVSSESSSVTFTLSEISEEETQDEDSTSYENRRAMSRSPSNSYRVKNTYFEDNSNIEEDSLRPASLELSKNPSRLQEGHIGREYSKETYSSQENDSESIRSNSPGGSREFQTPVSNSSLPSLNCNNSKSAFYNSVPFTNIPVENHFNGTTHNSPTSNTIIKPVYKTHEKNLQKQNTSSAVDSHFGMTPGKDPYQETRIQEREYDAFGNITNKSTVSYTRRKTYYDSPYIYPRELITESVHVNVSDNKSYVSLTSLTIGDYRQQNESISDPFSTGWQLLDPPHDVNQREQHVSITSPETNPTKKLIKIENTKTHKYRKCGGGQTSGYSGIDNEYTVTNDAEEDIDNISRNDNDVIIINTDNMLSITADNQLRDDTKIERHSDTISDTNVDNAICGNDSLNNSVTGDTGLFKAGDMNELLRGDSTCDLSISTTGDTSISESGDSFRQNYNGVLLKSFTNANVAFRNGDVRTSLTNDNTACSNGDLSKFCTSETIDSNKDDLSRCFTRNNADSNHGDLNISVIENNDVRSKSDLNSFVNITTENCTDGDISNPASGDCIYRDLDKSSSDGSFICSNNIRDSPICIAGALDAQPYDACSATSSNNCLGGFDRNYKYIPDNRQKDNHLEIQDCGQRDKHLDIQDNGQIDNHLPIQEIRQRDNHVDIPDSSNKDNNFDEIHDSRQRDNHLEIQVIRKKDTHLDIQEIRQRDTNLNFRDSRYKDVDIMGSTHRDNHFNDNMIKSENNESGTEINDGNSGQVSSYSACEVMLESAGSQLYTRDIESKTSSVTTKVVVGSSGIPSRNDAINSNSNNMNTNQRRQYLREKFRHLFIRDHSKQEGLKCDNSRMSVRNDVANHDIVDQTAGSEPQTDSFMPDTISSLPQTVSSISQTDSSMPQTVSSISHADSSMPQTVSSISQTDSSTLCAANSTIIKDLKQEVRVKYLFGEYISDNSHGGHIPPVSDESDGTFEASIVVSETDSFGKASYDKYATKGIQNNTWNQESQFSSMDNNDSWISKMDRFSVNDSVDESMHFMLGSANVNPFEEMPSANETITEPGYNSSVKRNVKVTTMFSNNFRGIAKSRMISDPSSRVGVNQDVSYERQDSTGCYSVDESQTQSCEGDECGFSRSTDGTTRYQVGKLKSRGSLLSLHEHSEVSSSIGRSEEGEEEDGIVSGRSEEGEEEEDIISTLNNYGDYDVIIMDMALGQCISLDSNERGAGALENRFENRLNEQLVSIAQVTSLDRTVGTYNERNIPTSFVDNSTCSIPKIKNVTREGCSKEPTALFTATCHDDEQLPGHTSRNDFDLSLKDPFRRLSFDTTPLEYHSTGAVFEMENTAKQASRWEISGSLSEPGDYRQIVDKPRGRQEYLYSLGRAKTSSSFLSPSSAELQPTQQTDIQSGEICITPSDASHPELSYLDILPKLSQHRKVITAQSIRRHDIKIVFSSPETTDGKSVATDDADVNTLFHQGSPSDKSEDNSLQMLLTQTPSHQGNEDGNLTEEVCGSCTSEQINVRSLKGQHVAQQELKCLDLQGIHNCTPSKSGRLIPLKFEDVTAQGLDVKILEELDNVIQLEIDTLVPKDLDDVTSEELDDLIPQDLDDLTTQELDDLIPQDLDDLTEDLEPSIPQTTDDVTTQEFDSLIAQSQIKEMIGELNAESPKQKQIEFHQKEENRLHLPISKTGPITIHSDKNTDTNQITETYTTVPLEDLTESISKTGPITIHSDKNTESKNITETYTAVPLEDLTAPLEYLRESGKDTERESAYMKSLSVTSRDSGFDSHGSPVDHTYKGQEQKYSAFTDPTMELSF